MVTALEQTYRINPFYAILINGLEAIGFALGAPIIGWISSKTDSKTRIMLFCAVGVSILLILARMIMTSLFLKSICLFLIGFLMGASILSFAIVKDLMPASVHGFVTGFVNMFFTLIGILLLPLVGLLLSITHENFVISMLPVVIATALSIPMALLLKEKKTLISGKSVP
jgi:MFS family permease